MLDSAWRVGGPCWVSSIASTHRHLSLHVRQGCPGPGVFLLTNGTMDSYTRFSEWYNCWKYVQHTYTLGSGRGIRMKTLSFACLPQRRNLDDQMLFYFGKLNCFTCGSFALPAKNASHTCTHGFILSDCTASEDVVRVTYMSERRTGQHICRYKRKHVPDSLLTPDCLVLRLHNTNSRLF